MPYPPKPPTGQGVAAALKRAGCNRSEILTPTQRYHFDGRPVRGSALHSEGYEVKTVRGQVMVRHVLDGAGPANEANVRRRTLRLQRYADALVQAGFLVRLSEKDATLTVHGRRR